MAQTVPNLPPILEPLPPLAEPRVSVLRWVLRIVRWSTYLAALITLILLLHKTPPPAVVSTPQAAATAEQKVYSPPDGGLFAFGLMLAWISTDPRPARAASSRTLARWKTCCARARSGARLPSRRRSCLRTAGIRKPLTIPGVR